MKSQAELKKPIEEGKEFEVHINWNDPSWDIRKDQLINTLPDTTTKGEIRERVNMMIIRESCFNVAMEYLVKLFTFKISESELNDIKKNVDAQLRPQFEQLRKNNADITEENLNRNVEDISKKSIMRTLIFEEIAKQKNVVITDEEAKVALKNYHEATGAPIEELEKGETFNEIKKMVLDNKISEVILNMFKFKPAEQPK